MEHRRAIPVLLPIRTCGLGRQAKYYHRYRRYETAPDTYLADLLRSRDAGIDILMELLNCRCSLKTTQQSLATRQSVPLGRGLWVSGFGSVCVANIRRSAEPGMRCGVQHRLKLGAGIPICGNSVVTQHGVNWVEVLQAWSLLRTAMCAAQTRLKRQTQPVLKAGAGLRRTRTEEC
jgi:hypothetical protein